MDKPKTNDGGGLWDNEGVCDVGITLCNDALKDLITGQYLLFANKIGQIAQIFANLKQGIAADRASMTAKVDELKRMNDTLVEQLTGLPVDNDTKEGEQVD